MGFWPYFLQAHESDGGYDSPLLLDPSTSPIGIDTTLFCMLLLLLSPYTSLIVISIINYIPKNTNGKTNKVNSIQK